MAEAQAGAGHTHTWPQSMAGQVDMSLDKAKQEKPGQEAPGALAEEELLVGQPEVA